MCGVIICRHFLSYYTNNLYGSGGERVFQHCNINNCTQYIKSSVSIVPDVSLSICLEVTDIYCLIYLLPSKHFFWGGSRNITLFSSKNILIILYGRTSQPPLPDMKQGVFFGLIIIEDTELQTVFTMCSVKLPSAATISLWQLKENFVPQSLISNFFLQALTAT